jgi:translation initiation factor IF-2
VIIDSQAGRKGGRGGTRGGPHGLSDADRPALKKKIAPGVESPVKIKSGASVKELGEALEIGAGELIKTLMKLGEMVTITQSLADDVISILAEEFERQVEIQHAEEEKEGLDQFVDEPADLSPRAPVVTIMGHVDHGKTSLLDAIRETEVVKSEAGGITQHIGAYQVTHNEKRVTFLDTPGHEAFTAMRARGAQATDIAVIVVAANDGVMPQTLEAISHAKAAEVPILVAINKMDLPDANSDHVKQQLSNEGLIPEAWGGETVMVEVSAKKKMNLEELMDMILLVAEVQDLKANAKAPGSGVVIEAQLDVGRGPVATVLVQRGTLRVGDAIVSGEAYGKVKAMFDFTGVALTKATPSVPAQVLGFNTLPVAGDFVMVVDDEREARQKAEQRTTRLRAEQLAKSRGGSSLDEFYRRLKEGRVKELPIVIKGDVGGSVEALEESLRNITHPEVKVEVIFAGVGGINESDIMLASASKAVVIGFNVRPSVAAKALAEQEGVDVRTYRVIYKAIEDVEAALVGMLEPEKVEEELGTAEIRTVFRASRIGTIAGCYVLTGKIVRSAKIRLVRNGAIIHEGTIGSLKRFADDQREVAAGYECGLHVDGYDDIHEGDIVEAYEIKEVARTQ